MRVDWQGLEDLADEMSMHNDASRISGKEAADCERDYRVELAAEILRLSAEGERATLIPDIARGNPDIADLKCRRDCAEVIYKADQEAVNVCKLKIRITEAQLERDWGAARYE